MSDKLKAKIIAEAMLYIAAPRAQHADRILTRYITLLMEKTTDRNDPDTRAELSNLISDAIDEAVEIAISETMERLRERVNESNYDEREKSRLMNLFKEEK